MPRIGVDIGGTFTDLVSLSETGELAVEKALTTPSDPSAGIEDVLTAAVRDVNGWKGQIVHGTTLVTNALIERKGAVTALLTTDGFKDSIEIGREHRYDLYDLMLEHPEPLVPRHLRFALPERTLADGTIEVPLDTGFVHRLVQELTDAGVEAIAVCLLHSYANPESETRALNAISEANPDINVSISSEVAAELGEYQRASTTIANVYVQDLVDRYLRRLGDRLENLGTNSDLKVMLSSGGVAAVETARRFPVRMLESGPAAGALAAAHVGMAIGRRSLVSFDMGGTTAKLCVIDDGEPLITHEFEVDRRYRFKRGSGLPVRVPVIEMIEIGAGGGSIARIDSLGLLKVGPDSAGADPGPSSYGLGGKLPTVTDADLVLGYLNPDYFLGGEMRLRLDLARKSIRDRIADPLSITVEEAAWGIHQVVNESMANAARVHTVERGKNPRALTMIGFGGAGPVHAYGVASLLGSQELVLPHNAGVMSAIGLLTAPLAFDFAHPHYTKLLSADWPAITSLLEDMERRGSKLLTSAGVAATDITHTRSAALRHIGQGHEIDVSLPHGRLGPDSLDSIVDDFNSRYLALYGREGPPVGLEALTWRVTSRGPSPDVATGSSPVPGAGDPLKGERNAYFPALGGFVMTPVFDRYKLGRGAVIHGPAIIEERESTAVIGPDGSLTVDAESNLVISIGEESTR